jgi:hypothetical protein
MPNKQRSFIVARAADLELHRQRIALNSLDDSTLNDTVFQIEDCAAEIAKWDSTGLADLIVKLELLAGRLREHVPLDTKGDMVDYMLAESARADAVRFARLGLPKG